ncbi:MAG TPA: 2OG-Fe dioxygenase family protein [Arenibaculum sp.]|nr:2OG-Fe dioxygenase family protein [Arenibaculum sp.]
MNVMSPAIHSPAIHSLAGERFVFGSSGEVLGHDLTAMPAWEEFRGFWNDLEIDRYMNDGGTYRFRRFGRFKWFADGSRLELQPHGPYSQPPYLNPLNGGMDRHFAPLTPEIASNQVLRRLLLTLGETYAGIEDVLMWKINVYLNRIVARGAEPGLPVPEGMHRDGVRFGCLLVAGRDNVEGGVTTLYGLDKEPLVTTTLARTGDCMLFRDDVVFHDTTPVAAVDPGREGHRDLLVVEFR